MRSFGREAPRTLEIGAIGMGQSLLEMGPRPRPSRDFYRGGSAIAQAVGLATEWRAMTANCRQPCGLRLRRIEVLNQCIPTPAWTQFFCSSPDPWPQEKSTTKDAAMCNWLSPSNLRSKLKIGGRYSIWPPTVKPYVEHICSRFMSAAPGYRNLAETAPTYAPGKRRPITKYERRWRALGHGVVGSGSSSGYELNPPTLRLHIAIRCSGARATPHAVNPAGSPASDHGSSGLCCFGWPTGQADIDTSFTRSS